MRASNVVSPVSSGLPPYPTVPSHCSISQTLQPYSMASRVVKLFLYNVSHAENIYTYTKMENVAFEAKPTITPVECNSYYTNFLSWALKNSRRNYRCHYIYWEVYI